MADQEVSESDVDAAIARAFGRPPTSRPPTVAETVREQLAAEACPWRTVTGLLEVEERLAVLRSSRRGESLAAAKRAVESSLRDVWCATPGTATARAAAVAEAMRRETAHFAAVPPIVPTPQLGATESRRPDPTSHRPVRVIASEKGGRR